MEPTLKKRGFTQPEIREIAAIHMEEIKTGFLSSFGIDFLMLIYRHIAQSELSVLIAAIDENHCVCGYICGTKSMGALYKEFLRVNICRLLVFLPRVMMLSRTRKMIETLFYPSCEADDGLPSAEIVNFAIREGYRGTGLARKLFSNLVSQFKSQGIPAFKFVTGEHQVAAQKFYDKVGAKNNGFVEVHKGMRSLLYVYRIEGAE